MGKIISTPLPHDLPENWDDSKYVSPGGTEVGLTEKHGYNYLMKQVNATQKAVEELDEEVDARLHYAGLEVLTPTNTGYNTLFDYIKSLYLKGVTHIIAKANGFSDMPRLEWGFTVTALNGEGDLWDVELIEALTNRRFARQLNTNNSWLQANWSKIVFSPAIEDMVFDRDDTKGSARLVKNSSANADYGFSIRDIADDEAEARLNVVASEQMVAVGFKTAEEDTFRNYELLHTANFSKVAAPVGLVRSFESVETEAQINNAIDLFVSQTKDNSQETFLLEVKLSGVIPSDLYFITIRKHMDTYVIVTGYGVISATDNTVYRRKVNGAWGAWRTSAGDAVIPATLEGEE